ncbi:CAAD domain-containing protein [Synechococcus sp. CBW1107]|uniref:CAAD domain-containing protein n=1 Tax=Synechococcus sp. CBW1107 TaxID=2789857 RepID=UPI002AD4B0B9|nr:CAAD domain-containing protein [Synechococcus sp. CBW1107]CAK6701040.1 hypothetical protein MNNICLKF_03013 [Synechococcus sp. CBW1107]
MAEAPAPKPDTEQQPQMAEEALEIKAVEAEAEPETVAVAAEQPAPEPAAEEPAAPEPPAVDTPTVASSIEVPASPQVNTGPAEQEGGEWDLLVQKLRSWIASGQLQEQWQAARTPLSLLAGLIAVLLVLRVYSAVLGVLNSIPLLPGLLELAGLVTVVQFSLTRLVRSQDRSEVIGGLKQRWKSFRGRS